MVLMTEEKIAAPEPPKLTKEELFQKEPENFFHADEIRMAVLVNDIGHKRVFVARLTPSDMGADLFLLQHHCSKIFYTVEGQAENASGLIKSANSKQGFRNFIKGKR